MLTVSGELHYRSGGWGWRGGKEVVYRIKEGHNRDELSYFIFYGPLKYKTGKKGKKIFSVGLYSTPRSCIATYSHLLVGQNSIKVLGHLYSSPLGLEKATNKSRPPKPVKFDSSFCVRGEKSNLQS